MCSRKHDKGVVRADFGADIILRIALSPRSDFTALLGMKEYLHSLDDIIIPFVITF